MAQKVRLVYGNYRYLKKGEAGYSKTKQLVVDPETGEIHTRKWFRNRASRELVEIPTKHPSKDKTRIVTEEGVHYRARGIPETTKVKSPLDYYNFRLNQMLDYKNKRAKEENI